MESNGFQNCPRLAQSFEEVLNEGLWWSADIPLIGPEFSKLQLHPSIELLMLGLKANS
jgi:hypothetical protein